MRKLSRAIGTPRWILVRQDGTSVKGTSYPSEQVAQRFAEPGERPRRMRVQGPSGPFSDFLTPDDNTEDKT